MEQNKRSRGGSGARPPSPRRLIFALAIAGTAMVPAVTLGDSIACGGAYAIAYVTPPTPPDPRFIDDVLTYQVTLTNQDSASTWTISSIQRKLDCQAGSDFSSCADPGGAITFLSMGSSTCKDASNNTVVITPDNSVSNLTTFGLSAPIVLPPTTSAPNNVCTIQFTAKIAGLSQDSSPNIIASRDKVLGTCDPTGESDGSATGSITTSVNTCGITLKKQVWDGTKFVDADTENGADVPTVIFKDADPSSLLDTGDVPYQLVVKNTSSVTMSSVVISDTDLWTGTKEVGPLTAGQEKTVGSGSISQLAGLGRCTAVADLDNTATAHGVCRVTTDVSREASDIAWVHCVGVPKIQVKKEISLDGTTWYDANKPTQTPPVTDPTSPDYVPTAQFGADAWYRITVTNTGTEDLKDVVVTDADLPGGLSYPLPGTGVDLPVGGDPVVLVSGTISALDVLHQAGRCDKNGDIGNTVHVEGYSNVDGTKVEDDDPAWLLCVRNPAYKVEKDISVDGKPVTDLTKVWYDANSTTLPDVIPSVQAPHDAMYRFIVTNTGNVPLVNPDIVDSVLGIDVPLTTTIPVGNVPGNPLIINSGTPGFAALDVKDRCTAAGRFTNTVSVQVTPIDVTLPLQAKEDPATLVCTSDDLCQTLTAGFWGTHPNITKQFLPITVCGKPLSDTGLDTTSSTEAMCVSGVDAKKAASNMNYLQLVRQLTAAKLNVAASATHGGTCDVVGGVNIDDLIAGCEAAALCGDSGAKGGSKITASGCIEKLDAFNQDANTTLAPFGPFVTPGPADSTTCQTSNGDGIIIR